MSGCVVHVEISHLHYSIVQTGLAGGDSFLTDRGYIGGGMLKRESPTASPMVTIDVTLAKSEKLGEMPILGSKRVEEMGWAGRRTSTTSRAT